MSFFRIKTPVNFPYVIADFVVTSVVEIKDLGVVFSYNMSFTSHVIGVAAKASKQLGLINRFSKRFSINAFRMLYCSLVRSILEYASVVWSPYYSCDINIIERVQKRFMMTCHFRLGGSRMDYSCSAMARQLSLVTLETRRYNADMCFLYKLMNGMIDCDCLRSLVSLNPGSITRRRVIFRLDFHSTNYAFHTPITRMCRFYNDSNLQIFDTTYDSFRRALLR